MNAFLRYPLPEEVILYLERLHFTRTGLENLIMQFTYQSEFPIDAERYDQLLSEYLSAHAELELALAKVYREKVAPEFLNDAYYTQEVDFIAKEILVNKKGDTHACSCRTCHN